MKPGDFRAFPSSITNEDGKYSLGMKLRDYFAAMALTALTNNENLTFGDIAKNAYIAADAMMEARKR